MINRAIDELRRQKHHQAKNEQKQVEQGNRLQLLGNFEPLVTDSQDRLLSLLVVNQFPLTMETIKEPFMAFLTIPNRKVASSFLHIWCFNAMSSGVKHIVKIGLALIRNRNCNLNYFSQSSLML